jgi:hypothetical protein
MVDVRGVLLRISLSACHDAILRGVLARLEIEGRGVYEPFGVHIPEGTLSGLSGPDGLTRGMKCFLPVGRRCVGPASVGGVMIRTLQKSDLSYDDREENK